MPVDYEIALCRCTVASLSDVRIGPGGCEADNTVETGSAYPGKILDRDSANSRAFLAQYMPAKLLVDAGGCLSVIVLQSRALP